MSTALSLLLALQSASMFPHPKGYLCHRAESPIVIDGQLDEAAWKAAPWTDFFVDIEGDKKPRPRFKTRAKMLWDDRYFYIAAQMEEPHVWATLTEHDSVIFHDNDFEVFIDPNGDNHEYYEFEINALNTGWDLRLPKPYRDGGPALNEWEIPGLKTAVHIDGTLNDPSDRDKGWSVEIAFPWKVLGAFAGCPAPPREGDQWRVNFSRVEWQVRGPSRFSSETSANETDLQGGPGRSPYTKVKGKPEDNWVWSPQHAIDMHRPEYWGYVQFTSKAPGKARFEKDPTWAARMRVMEVYFAQKAYFEKHKRWATDGAALGLTLGSVRMQASGEGWTAWTTVRQRLGKRWRVSVRQDSKLEVKPG